MSNEIETMRLKAMLIACELNGIKMDKPPEIGEGRWKGLLNWARCQLKAVRDSKQ